MEENQSSIPTPNNESEQNLSHSTEEIKTPEVATPDFAQSQSEIPVEQPHHVDEAPLTKDKSDSDAKLFAALSYMSALFIVPWVTKKDNQFVAFHVKQGMALFIVEIIAWFVLWLVEAFLEGVFSYHVFGLVQFIYKLAWLVFGAASILGIYHALTDKEKPLPYLAIVTKNLKL